MSSTQKATLALLAIAALAPWDGVVDLFAGGGCGDGLLGGIGDALGTVWDNKPIPIEGPGAMTGSYAGGL